MGSNTKMGMHPASLTAAASADRFFRQLSRTGSGVQADYSATWQRVARLAKRRLFSTGEMVLIKSFAEDEQLYYKPSVRGHEHVAVVEACTGDEVTVRLLHRDPDSLAAMRPDIVSQDEDVPLVR